MNSTDSLLSLLKIFKKWFRAIFIVCTVAVIGTVIISLSMDNYYKSTTTFYAASSDLAKPAPIGGFEINLNYYGRDEDIDRLLSIANSGEVAERLVDEFNLISHYGINAETQKGKFKVYEHFRKLFKVQKNKFDAIEISVEDVDPELAKNISNRAREIVSEIAQRTIKNSQDLQIEQYRMNISKKTIDLDSLTSKIEVAKDKYGIFDTEYQGQALTEALAQAETDRQVNAIKEEINNFTKGVSRIKVLEQEQREFGLQLSLDKERYKQLVNAKQSNFSAIHLIEEAKVPLVKSRPKRSILVIAAAFISLFFSLLAALVVEKYRSINWKAI